jgi:surface antigen
MRVPLSVILAASLAACSTSEELITKENVGAVVGGVIGGVVGSQFGGGSGRIVAGVAGSIIGALAGRAVGRHLSRNDRLAAERAQDQAHGRPVGETVTWRNPETGHSGTVTPLRENTDAEGRVCREYRGTVTIDGRDEEATGTACRQPDGSWRFAER